MGKQTIIWYKEHVTDLREQMQMNKAQKFDSVVVNITHPLFKREFEKEKLRDEHQLFTRSDLILSPSEWLDQVVLKLSSDLELDSEDDAIRKHSEKVLMQELNMASHLIQNGYVLMELKPGNSTNLARSIMQSSKCVILVELPMTDIRLTTLSRRKDLNTEELLGEDPWERWNRFRCHADFSSKIRLSLTLTEDLPSTEEIKRWLGEPVECINIPDYLFLRNHQNYPVLSRPHQQILAQFLKFNVHLMIQTNDEYNQHYVEYLDYLARQKFKRNDMMAGFDDLLQIPLQPLYDNLDSYTYEVFEKDPVKYKKYQEAVEAALVDRVSDKDLPSKVSVVMIVGAGRGPLVRAVINASKKTGRKVRIYIIEKNPNAIITLHSLRNEIWKDADIQIFSKDMRECEPPEKADIIVSELLGSFGDNELSPECLDGAQKLLKPDGISIPCSSTSFVNPVMSSKLYNAIRLIDRMYHPRDKNASVVANFENNYVVYPKNVYHIDDPKPLFTFVHPNHENLIDNSRFASLEFTSKVHCVLHGFIGYFETVLYKDIILSINPFTHTAGLSSWFSFLLPITEPQQIAAGQKITANFWRCTSSHKVWYEWSVSSPQISHIHNSGGRFCPIYK
ncbi:protein arginine N-methyltransferase 5-like [Culicoides brevitarsis]|uniref:protein arginine N-methyltransferase 5-like n=1 Tax=Culicoides brevitarsis TaxID=469753 RepID=UPI00307CB0F4